ncbi:hypothetical protein Peur_032955 [Populus x canadensis]
MQRNQPCYLPSTARDHASYAFKNYYQKFKHEGATCYFNAAALITDLDPTEESNVGVTFFESPNDARHKTRYLFRQDLTLLGLQVIIFLFFLMN